MTWISHLLTNRNDIAQTLTELYTAGASPVCVLQTKWQGGRVNDDDDGDDVVNKYQFVHLRL